jgi:hypothetical protein
MVAQSVLAFVVTYTYFLPKPPTAYPTQLRTFFPTVTLIAKPLKVYLCYKHMNKAETYAHSIIKLAPLHADIWPFFKPPPKTMRADVQVALCFLLPV